MQCLSQLLISCIKIYKVRESDFSSGTMHYLDIVSSLSSQSLTNLKIKKKSSSGSLHDSDSYALSDSGQYIGSEEPHESVYKYVHSFTALLSKQCAAKLWLEIAILIVVICLMVYIAPNQNVAEISIKNNDDKQKYLYILSEKGQNYRLHYLKPQIVKPPVIQQQKLELLILPNSSNFTQYEENFNDKVQFSSKLFLSWLRGQQQIYEAQYYRYHKKYDLERQIPQNSFCIVSPFRNVVSSSEISWKLFIQSINSQNYSNYHVYMIDDFSDDNSTYIMLDQIKRNYPRLNNRVTFIRNLQKKGALGNRDTTVRNFCQPKDIVLDIDGDDALIGRQVFNVVNRIYQSNPNVWFMYMNYLSVIGRMKGEARNINFDQKMQPGICQSINPQTFRANTYRTKLTEWVTSQLRTYLRDLYVKIPLRYVVEQGSRNYYIEASDRFSMYPLAELAGINHTLYVEEFVYFYFQPNFLILEQKQCTLPQLFYSEAQARIMAPLLPLIQLTEPAQSTRNYLVPKQIQMYYLKKYESYRQCIFNLKQNKKMK